MLQEIINKIKGCLWGQAIGDALGLGTEFMSKSEVRKYYPHSLHSYEQIIQDQHRKRWEKGDWTDDTDMMLCLLNAFDSSGFDFRKAAKNFKEWYNGEPVGIGRNMIKVLLIAEYVNHPFVCSELIWNSTRRQSAANGALMRTSIMALWPQLNQDWVEQACKLTHYDPRCVFSCKIFCYIIHSLVWLSNIPEYDHVTAIAKEMGDELLQYIRRAHYSSIPELNLHQQPGIGYTYRTLSAALSALWHSSSFEEGVLEVVNEGGDADTNGAVVGALLGAKYGFDNIPSYYIENLCHKQEYEVWVNKFIALLESQ